ncbi:MAG: anaerobic sulfatase maturase, partial [Deltaproteobacteria bacterium]
MSSEVLEAFVRQYIALQDAPEVQFTWQGGEPTLLGVELFRRVVELQKKYANGKKVSNSIQTNGILLDDRWCEFLTDNGFLVGLSIDGPRKLHDLYRVDKRQRPTFDRVMRSLEFLKKHDTEFNTLTVVNNANSRYPLEVYRFLKEVGKGFMQFIPLVERKPDKEARELGLELGMPPVPGEKDTTSCVTPWSVKPDQFGEFYVQIFDEWVRQDVGKYFIQFFDVALGNWMGHGSTLCIFAQE